MPERKMRADAAASTQMGMQRQGGPFEAHLTQISPLRPYQAREGGTIYMTSTPKPFDRSEGAKRDIIAGGIVVAAILLFVGTGSTVMQAAVRALIGIGGGPDRALATALVLNIALILFGWRRYKDLNREIVERTEAEQRARYLADTDPLTGFLNRRALLAAGQRMIAGAAAEKRQVALFLLDLDHFKTVNDIHGHAAGDRVLQVAAERISAVLPPTATKARLGGDEFVAMLAFEPAARADIDALAAELVTALDNMVTHDAQQIRIGASLGISLANDASMTMETMVRQADIAMYHCKDEGRNRFCWFEAGMEMAVQVRNQIETGIREGMPRGEFVPHFEPQVDIASGRLIGFAPARATLRPDQDRPQLHRRDARQPRCAGDRRRDRAAGREPGDADHRRGRRGRGDRDRTDAARLLEGPRLAFRPRRVGRRHRPPARRARSAARADGATGRAGCARG